MDLQEYLNLQNDTNVCGIALEGIENQPAELTKEAAENIAKAFCVWLISRTGKTQVSVAVGYDPRLSAPPLCSAIINGITTTGHTAVVTGLSTTPSMFTLLKDEVFAEKSSCDGSIMITASHLPSNYNGMKFFSKNGALSAEDITELLTLAATYKFATTKPGHIEFRPYLNDYAALFVKTIQEATKQEQPLSNKKIVIDASNGTAGFFADKVLQKLGADTANSQGLTPDGNFVNHAPDTQNQDAVNSLSQAVKDAQADAGILFDADADNALILNQNGETLCEKCLASVSFENDYFSNDNACKLAKLLLSLANEQPTSSAEQESTEEQLEIVQAAQLPVEEKANKSVAEEIPATSPEAVQDTQLEIPADIQPIEPIAEYENNEKQLGDMDMDVQQTTINAVRVLSAEAIEKAKSGHPGLPLGCAPIAYTLFQHFLKFNPRNANWNNRDRFVLSAGHGSAMYYTLLYLYNYGLQKEDLMNFRQFGSKTPGHPEYRHTIGIETTTGPLGQGLANAVGMAMAEAHLAAKFNKPGFPVVDHYTYAICGDGCLEEGISYEACSFAGTQGLGKLILFYDDNDITIEGDTDSAFKENVGARFASQNWQVLHVDLVSSPDDVEALSAAIEKAKAKTDKPSVIICHTRIGYGSPLEGSEKSHGAPLGAENLQKTKAKLNWPCKEAFDCPQEVFDHCALAANAGAEKEMQWKKMFAEYEYTYPELAKAYQEIMEGKLPNLDDMDDLYAFDKPMATRQTSEKVLNKLAANIPQLVGGSADLAPSNLSKMKDTASVTYGDFSPKSYDGRNIQFGIREHAMAAIANGMQLHGGMQAYCATFFVFADYCKPAMRLAALMGLPVTYIMTHDSIGVGEDGPTHQPVEQLIMLRSTPGIKVFRPADGKETAAAWVSAITGNQPTALVLTRQNLPQYANSGKQALKGGYVLEDCDGTPDVLLIGTGSEVELCMKAKASLEVQGVKARVISMPCVEEFEKQTAEYKESVLPKAVKARVCVEAGSPYSWYKYAGDYGELVCMSTFGASAPAAKLFAHFGFTAENVAEKALQSIRNVASDAE